ncbi:MAG: 4-(cytidine 5'-diphospho)-2-C-methyl-D-erythritol kinase, partial [Pseudomonadota bacterium]|nr:4-(cytidine 5'-diphospho)-2-C-methyl-D-erythritol kinase [Pseudomonadota bacterium]
MRKNEIYLCLDAPAKINLYLHITGRRPDGYHLLDSLVGFTEYADRVFASPADELSLRIQGAHGLGLQGNEEDNLIMRSARALRDSFGVREGAALTLEKNLPVSSGIGGGSSDAAAALRLLARLWKVDVNDRDLSDIGLKIGSDIPVCIVGTPSKMSGVGETVHPAKPLPNCAVLLVNGGEAVSTSAVFGASRH